MPRPPRPQIDGGTYHVTSRGIRGKPIFNDDSDRRYWLSLLSGAVSSFNWICHTYCLLTNHYHLLIDTPKANISRGMHLLNSEHAHWFNWRHGYKGHLFQARFHSVVVDDDAHFEEATRYIALNPVRAGLVAHPERWTWSAYAATLGLRRSPNFLASSRILAQFSDDVAEARRLYRNFVEAGLDVSPTHMSVPGTGMFVGDMLRQPKP
jgi:putative transposase